MSYEKHREAQIIDRCWLIYDLLTSAFLPSDTFHSGFPSLVETAIISHDLHINMTISEGFTLHIREEYEFSKHKLNLHSYSYNLLDHSGNSVLRSDNLPYHQTDYKGHQLTHPPHHIHDKSGRISSFTGNLEDFFNLVRNKIP